VRSTRLVGRALRFRLSLPGSFASLAMAVPTASQAGSLTVDKSHPPARLLCEEKAQREGRRGADRL